MGITDQRLHINTVLSEFGISSILEINEIGTGHINSSFLILHTGGRAFLQMINAEVFPEVPKLQNNIKQLINHLADTDKNYPLQMYPAANGNNFVQDDFGNYWRLLNFIDGNSFEICEKKEIAIESGRIISEFHQNTKDLDTSQFYPVIPDFHNLSLRIKRLEEVIEIDAHERFNDVKTEIDFIRSNWKKYTYVDQFIGSGEVTNQIVHNDTKLNNILFDEFNKAICLIDLDTIMPGFVSYDFGDVLRTMASSELEDSDAYQQITFLIDTFKHFVTGYLTSSYSHISSQELGLIHLSPGLMTLIMGVRFLTDYLEGDKYYRIKYSTHNLVRSKNQLTLLKSIQKYEDEMEYFIHQFIK